MKVCFYGDSIGRGVIFDEARGRYGYSEHSFAHLLEDHGLMTLQNRCRFGCTSGKGLGIMQAEADRMADYDYVAIMYGGNDSDYDWPAVAENPLGPVQAKSALVEYESNLREMIELVRRSGSTPVLLSMIPLDPEKYFSWITQKSSPDSLLKFLGNRLRLYRGNEMYNLALFRQSALCGVPLIDVCTPFLCNRDFDDLLCRDGIHPTDKGHSLIYQAVCSFLQQHNLLQKGA